MYLHEIYLSDLLIFFFLLNKKRDLCHIQGSCELKSEVGGWPVSLQPFAAAAAGVERRGGEAADDHPLGPASNSVIQQLLGEQSQ